MTTTNRRNFIKAATAAGGSILIAPQLSKANVVEQKLPKGEINIAFIGVRDREKASKMRKGELKYEKKNRNTVFYNSHYLFAS